MAPPIHSMKVPVKARLAELLADVQDATFEYAFAADAASVRTITLGVARSVEQEVSGFKAGRKRRDERWTQDIWLEVQDPDVGATPEATDRACDLLYNEVEDLFADDPDMGLEGLAWGVLTSDEVSGPFPMQSGWVQRRRLQIEFFTQLV